MTLVNNKLIGQSEGDFPRIVSRGGEHVLTVVDLRLQLLVFTVFSFVELFDYLRDSGVRLRVPVIS